MTDHAPDSTDRPKDEKPEDDILVELIPKEFDYDEIQKVRKEQFSKAALSKQGIIEKAYQLRSAKDFMCFVRGITIAGQHGPRIFEEVMADFQRDFFKELASNLEECAEGKMPGCRRWWVERTKKAGKDSDLALIIIWLIAFPKRPFFMQVGAADKAQASIVKERVVHLLHWNEWLNEHLEVIQWEVRSKKKMIDGSPMAKLEILSSDTSGSHGGTPDVLIINELSHVADGKLEFIENLMDNADGVAQGLIIIATNAGYKGTKPEVWRNNALSSDNWGLNIWARPAPWHDSETIKEAEKRNTRSRFRRLWKGEWPSGKGDALDEDAVKECFKLKGPILEPVVGWQYIGALDLGISHDHSALVVLGVHEDKQIIQTVLWKAWEPGAIKREGRKGEVDLMEVEKYCLAAHKRYHLRYMFYDPFQAKLMAQRLFRQFVPMKEMTFASGKNLDRMASCLIQAVEDRKLECYDDVDHRLENDLGKFNIVEKSYGYRLEAVSDETGHADVGTALAIGLPGAFDIMEGIDGLRPEDDLIAEDVDLSKEELDTMPDDLKGILEMSEEVTYQELYGTEDF